METLTVNLEKSTFQFVSEQATQAGFASAEDYVRAMLDELQTERLQLETRLLAGLDAEPVELNEAEWRSIRAEAHERLARSAE